ncbi:permease [Acetivibrio straminisolvens JCM 21531]|uniref:Permease n=1 Tax=Acetivibrio straminisolvens JCM 21531 TaxID=1294263 RepID=W4V6P4_9FIRM|nr:permease [Acetivibrio straminisolvens JCM 21531]
MLFSKYDMLKRGKTVKKYNFGYLFLMITVIFFSTYEVVSKTIIGRVNPFQINFLRFFIGGSLLFLFLLIKHDLKIDKKTWQLLLWQEFST